MYSPQFTKHCTETGRWPVISYKSPARNTTIAEELEHLREDYLSFPDKRWQIERRATMLQSAQARLSGHPLPPKHLTDDEFETAAISSLS